MRKCLLIHVVILVLICKQKYIFYNHPYMYIMCFIQRKPLYIVCTETGLCKNTIQLKLILIEKQRIQDIHPRHKIMHSKKHTIFQGTVLSLRHLKVTARPSTSSKKKTQPSQLNFNEMKAWSDFKKNCLQVKVKFLP